VLPLATVVKEWVGISLAFYALLLGGCNEFDVVNSTVPYIGYQRTSGVAYGELGRQKLDVYVPEHVKGTMGVVVFFYGGVWQNGERGNYRFVAQGIVSQGFIAVMPDYRLWPGVTFPAFVEDGALAVKWVHENIARFGGDPNRIFLAGHSAGGHIAALLTLDGRYLKGVGLDRGVIRATAGLAGPYDFVPSEGDRGVFGMGVADVKPPEEIEPIRFVDGLEPPMVLIQGLADRTVDSGNAVRLAERIRAKGGRVKLITYPGVGHVGLVLSMANAFRWIAPTLTDMGDYFREESLRDSKKIE
jgi:acetyl esterase/lipase